MEAPLLLVEDDETIRETIADALQLEALSSLPSATAAMPSTCCNGLRPTPPLGWWCSI